MNYRWYLLSITDFNLLLNFIKIKKYQSSPNVNANIKEPEARLESLSPIRKALLNPNLWAVGRPNCTCTFYQGSIPHVSVLKP